MVEGQKKSYEKPRLLEYGTVSELTQTFGMSVISDTGFSGSMETMKKGGL